MSQELVLKISFADATRDGGGRGRTSRFRNAVLHLSRTLDEDPTLAAQYRFRVAARAAFRGYVLVFPGESRHIHAAGFLLFLRQSLPPFLPEGAIAATDMPLRLLIDEWPEEQVARRLRQLAPDGLPRVFPEEERLFTLLPHWVGIVPGEVFGRFPERFQASVAADLITLRADVRADLRRVLLISADGMMGYLPPEDWPGAREVAPGGGMTLADGEPFDVAEVMARKLRENPPGAPSSTQLPAVADAAGAGENADEADADVPAVLLMPARFGLGLIALLLLAWVMLTPSGAVGWRMLGLGHRSIDEIQADMDRLDPKIAARDDAGPDWGRRAFRPPSRFALEPGVSDPPPPSPTGLSTAPPLGPILDEDMYFEVKAGLASGTYDPARTIEVLLAHPHPGRWGERMLFVARLMRLRERQAAVRKGGLLEQGRFRRDEMIPFIEDITDTSDAALDTNPLPDIVGQCEVDQVNHVLRMFVDIQQNVPEFRGVRRLEALLRVWTPPEEEVLPPQLPPSPGKGGKMKAPVMPPSPRKRPPPLWSLAGPALICAPELSPSSLGELLRTLVYNLVILARSTADQQDSTRTRLEAAEDELFRAIPQVMREATGFHPRQAIARDLVVSASAYYDRRGRWPEMNPSWMAFLARSCAIAKRDGFSGSCPSPPPEY